MSSASPICSEQVALRAARQMPLLQRLGDFLDAVEGDGDAPLVVGEGDAHRQRLGDEQQPVVVGRLDLQVARGRQRGVLVRLDDQPHGLRLALGQRLDDALGEAADQRLLVHRVHADEHRGARLEEDGDALAAGAEGEGDAREGVLALQPLDLDALAELQRPDVDFSAVHATLPPPGGLNDAAAAASLSFAGVNSISAPSHTWTSRRAD